MTEEINLLDRKQAGERGLLISDNQDYCQPGKNTRKTHGVSKRKIQKLFDDGWTAREISVQYGVPLPRVHSVICEHLRLTA